MKYYSTCIHRSNPRPKTFKFKTSQTQQQKTTVVDKATTRRAGQLVEAIVSLERKKRPEVGYTIDRLVKADVNGIELAFIRGQKSSETFTLANLMHTMSVAVSLSTENPSFFSFNKPFSIIPPLSSSSYTLLSQPSDQPPLTDPPNAITVKTNMVHLGKANHDDLSLLSVFQARTPNFDLCLSKAISGCSGNQLMVLLKSAAVSGKTDLVRTLINNGGDVNHKDSVEAGHLDVVNALVSSGCEIDNSIDHVFHYAAAINSVDLMDALFRAYENTDALNRAARVGDVNGIKSYIGKGANVNGKDQNGWRPLHRAAFKGKLECVRTLLGYGGNAKLIDDNGH
ncbi:protein VAPYRIN-LIKE-like [Hibiscus syriacus]|uniref:protein VAPYRIN-LIKE-like n=1 Tax=Hibiscus syriacus TaxID=106335 RepID=UPI001922E031|nr:protein VAPYRIN-LIKE-like [Hibiscus syriacus]